MFEIVSRIPAQTPGSLSKTGGQAAGDGASAALYDQILRSVLVSLPGSDAVPTSPAATVTAELAETTEAAPALHSRTLEDVLMQRQVCCSLDETQDALPGEQIALHQQALTPTLADRHALLDEALSPWELLLGRLTLQQRLAG